MKRTVFKTFAAMLAMVFMLLLSSGCAEPVPGDPDNPINKHPADTEVDIIQLKFIYDQALADKATAGEVDPMALDPSFPVTYVGLGGDAVNPTCTDPGNPACRIDISGSCSLGACNASVAIAVGSKRTIWVFYNGQVHVERISLTSAQMTPNTYYLGNFITLSGDTLPATSPLHKTWPAACVRVDRPTATTIEVNRDIATWTNCQESLYTYELYGIGDSADNRLDDDLLAWTGDRNIDGDIKIKSTLIPPTVVAGSTLFPRILWNPAATPQPAYTERFNSVTSGQSLWFAVYSHDRGDAALPGDIAPIKGGIYVRTYAYNPATRTFSTTASSCTGATTYGVELVNMLNLNSLTPLSPPFYILQIQGTTAATGCPIQGADTRPVTFGFTN